MVVVRGLRMKNGTLRRTTLRTLRERARTGGGRKWQARRAGLIREIDVLFKEARTWLYRVGQRVT